MSLKCHLNATKMAISNFHSDFGEIFVWGIALDFTWDQLIYFCTERKILNFKNSHPINSNFFLSPLHLKVSERHF